MKLLIKAAFASLVLLLTLPAFLVAQTEKQRVLVLTDIEADPDDSQSLVRFLLYANHFDIEGLVATTSTHQRTRVAPETIHKILNAYEKVQPNLLKHEVGFPSAMELRMKVKQGLPVYGMEGVGEGKDSEGSDLIISALEKSDSRPLWISVWGGPNTLAQALWKIEKTRSKADAMKLYSKLRVYTISDQDDSGPWIRKTFPDLFYIVSPGGGYGTATWSGIMRAVPGSNSEVISNEWFANNIQQGHGPLGAEYPDIAYGAEGDTPSYLGLINNGLNDMEHPNYGGWGGRYELYKPEVSQGANIGSQRTEPTIETRPIWTNANDSFSPLIHSYTSRPRPDTVVYEDNLVTIWRWREEFQNDFAARMDWTIKSFEEANHPPVVRVADGDQFTVKSGSIFKLDADGTTDPDGDSMSYYWFQYPEAGTYKGVVSFAPYSPNLYNIHTIKAPEVNSKQTIHFILKVTDKGSPRLTRYKRVIVTVVP